MPTPVKFRSPRMDLHITAEQYEAAKQSSSGGCLIADAIKKQYPHLSGITVDMATIRASDRKKGIRYVYLTPPDAQQTLLFFDQGWRQPVEEVTVQRAVKVIPIIASTKQANARKEKLAELTAKKESGESLSKSEKASLTRLRNAKTRPTARGKAQVNEKGTVVNGGNPPSQGTRTPNDNLLRGSSRHFGAKLADPGEVFKQAVDEAVAEHVANGQ